jgi:hypothetical protein
MKRVLYIFLVLFISILIVVIPVTLSSNLQIKPAKAQANDASVAAGVSATFKMKSKPVKIGKNVKVTIKIKYNGEKLANAQVRLIATGPDGVKFYDSTLLTNKKGKVKFNIPTSKLSPGSSYNVSATVFIADCWYPIGSGNIATKGPPVVVFLNEPPVLLNAYPGPGVPLWSVGDEFTIFSIGYDNDGDTYKIRVTYFPDEFQVLGFSSYDSQANFKALKAGTYTIGVQLVDEHGAESNTIEVSVTVLPVITHG